MSSSSKKHTLQLVGQLSQLPHQIFLSGGTSLCLRLPNICMVSDAKKLLLKTADTVTKKNKLRRIIQGWSQLWSRRSIDMVPTRRSLKEKRKDMNNTRLGNSSKAHYIQQKGIVWHRKCSS